MNYDNDADVPIFFQNDAAVPLFFQNNIQHNAEEEVSNSEVPGMRNFRDINGHNFPFVFADPVDAERIRYPYQFVPRRALQQNLIAESIIHLDVNNQRCPKPSHSDIRDEVFRRCSLNIYDDVLSKRRVWEAISLLARERGSEMYLYQNGGDDVSLHPHAPDGSRAYRDTQYFYFDNRFLDSRINFFVERRSVGLSHILVISFTFETKSSNIMTGEFDYDIFQYICLS